MDQESAQPSPDGILMEQIKSLLRARRIGAEYQPIVSTRSLRVAGYEALSRFYLEDGAPLPPNVTFAAIQRVQRLFGLVEYQTKRLQIEHAPANFPLFINVDPLAYFGLSADRDETAQSFAHLLRHQEGLVVELIECANSAEVFMAQRMARVLNGMNRDWALDDVGGDNTVLPIDLFTQARYLKLDQTWLRRTQQPGSLDLLRGIVRYARKAGKLTVLEGVETEADLTLAEQLGVDYVQGYLFRGSFINVTAFPEVVDPLPLAPADR